MNWFTCATVGWALVDSTTGDTLLNHYILEHSWLWLTRTDYALAKFGALTLGGLAGAGATG